MNSRSYVLITPAKNEAAFIGKALDSIVGQTVRPAQWIIVDDGSTDNTSGIVGEYARAYPFITVWRVPAKGSRNFSSKAAAFNAGLKLVRVPDYSFIGNLDADISLEPSYYESVLNAFEKNPRLGISGGKVCNCFQPLCFCGDQTMDSVGGAVQLFRRECFEQIGGYQGLPFGGIDASAEIIARWKGWKVQKIDRPVYEHRPTGLTQHGVFKARFKDGLKFHTLGYSSVFFACRCISKMSSQSPLILGGVLSFLGFAYAKLRNIPISVPPEAVTYLRSEQKEKLLRMLNKGRGGETAAATQ